MSTAVIEKESGSKMAKAIEFLKAELKGIRTGRAHPGLVEHIKVDYYGTDTPLAQVANVTVEDARTLAISPWDKSIVQAIEKAIFKSDLGLTPNTAGTVPPPPSSAGSRRPPPGP